MGEGGVDYTKIEKVSLEIANHWSDTNFLNERNHNSGVLVGFDWKENDICEYFCVWCTKGSLGSFVTFLY